LTTSTDLLPIADPPRSLLSEQTQATFETTHTLLEAYDLCWSYDKSRLAARVQNLKRGTTPPNDKLEVFSLRSNLHEEVDVSASLTSQCWSPDGKQIVYEADDTVRVYDTERKLGTFSQRGKKRRRLPTEAGSRFSTTITTMRYGPRVRTGNFCFPRSVPSQVCCGHPIPGLWRT